MAQKVLTRLEHERRFRLRLSQTELASLAHLFQPDISAAENLRARPQVWEALARVLRLTPDELMAPAPEGVAEQQVRVREAQALEEEP